MHVIVASYWNQTMACSTHSPSSCCAHIYVASCSLHVASFMLVQAELIEHTSVVPKAELSETANATPISAEVRHWADYI